MAAGASDTSTFSGIYAITQADIDAGVVYNLAMQGTPIGKIPSNSSTDPTPCTALPSKPRMSTCTMTPLTQNPVLEVVKRLQLLATVQRPMSIVLLVI
jgi:hypothetical protein